ncbi:EAL domain-containing protein [Bacterioplanoides sp.]|uniref:EAL domain-containing protein n=1 Tax=Bacterioplanoides sp. TaxID=2066072 RepID=UPI003B5B44FD
MQKLFLCLLLFFPLLFSGHSVSAQDLSQKRILLLFSYHSTFPTSTKVLDGLHQAFADNQPILDVEYMDSKHINDDASQQLFRQLLGYKLKRLPAYDLIITADDNALDFVIANHQPLFAGAPVIFLGVNDLNKALSLEDTPWITGVVEAPSFADSLSVARGLFPQRDNVYVIVDNRVSGQSDYKSLLGFKQDFADLHFHPLSLQQLNWQQLGNQLSLLGSRDLVLLLSAYSDKDSNFKTFDESLAFITEHNQVPLFHFWEHGMGDGILGGVLVSHKEQGLQAGMMARRVLSGESIDNINILANSPNRPMFDFQQLKTFGLQRSQLPQDSLVLFQPESLWYKYRTQLSVLTLFFLMLIGAAMYLINNNIKMRRLSHRLAEQTSFFRLLMATLPDLVWIKDPKGVYLACNKRFEQFFGASEKDIVNKTDYDFVEKELADAFRNNDLLALNSNSRSINEEQIQYASDGRTELLETIKTPVYDKQHGRLLGVLGVGRDITQRKANEESLRLLASVVKNTAEGVVITNADRRIIEINSAFSEITGYQREEALGNNPSMLKSGEQGPSFYANMWHNINDRGRWSGEIYNRRKNGDIFPAWQTISEVRNNAGDITHYVSVFSDISELKKTQEKISYLAYHDSLTNLPNRVLLKERLDQAIKHADRSGQSFTLMYMDLDNFKNINDSMGHTEGDQLLIDVADNLRSILREKDTIGRLGGDEFVLLFDDLDHPEQAAHLAEKILEHIQQPIQLSNNVVNVSASIGICMYPQDGSDAGELWRNSDAAMYRAKQLGRNTYNFYTEELTRQASERMQIESDLRHALIRNEFALYYQPQIDTETQQIIGVEALIRWIHPERGLVPPDQFIPVAEETGLILAIGEWVLEQAAWQAKTWLDQGINIGAVAVNIAGPQITKEDLTEKVKSVLKRYDLPPQHLALELTETFIMTNEQTIRHLQQLSELGIELAIDDFGTGYSSLSYLKKLPIHKLKIDKSFIGDIPVDADDMAICRTIIALSENLGLSVLAEGVETMEQSDYLKQHGCIQAQGYGYSRPLPAPELEAFYYNWVGQDKSEKANVKAPE